MKRQDLQLIPIEYYNSIVNTFKLPTTKIERTLKIFKNLNWLLIDAYESLPCYHSKRKKIDELINIYSKTIDNIKSDTSYVLKESIKLIDIIRMSTRNRVDNRLIRDLQNSHKNLLVYLFKRLDSFSSFQKNLVGISTDLFKFGGFKLLQSMVCSFQFVN